MKKILFVSLLIAALTTVSSAQNRKRPAPKKSARAAVSRPSSSSRQQLQKALELARGGQYQAAASSLYSLARRPELQSDRAQIKYILGLMLMEMKLNQVAAFQFVDVIRTKHLKYTKLAVEKLSIVADGLGDDTLLNYALGRMDLSDIPVANRDMISFRIGEVKLKNRDYAGAESAFARVNPGSSYYNQAMYNRGLAALEQNKTDQALAAFQNLLALRGRASVTDTNKVAAQLSIARTLYQKKDWDRAIEAYSQVPRDHVLWHDALFEQSWAMLRSARFRSALSNFQSLHSAYYEDFFIPESLLLRAIVYLYICKYDEMEKVLQLFEKTYGPVSSKVRDFIRSNSSSSAYFREAEKAWLMKKGAPEGGTTLPIIVLNNVIEQGDVRRSMNYLTALDEEKAKIEANYPFRSSSIGQYALKIISSRRRNTTNAIGDMVKAHLSNMRTELRDLYEQASFIRYEMINGKKEALKKKIVGKGVEESVDEDVDRSFYVENGYDYYPFQGEFWLDEIGNYHYLGKSSCE
ncbi:MAG TPA: tetratricopeptide repeat protein [Pseudobdellovibrionaceae bacterium]|nr:tetratricopeptide repeat protein [Pseudobdellovibrionaceae bacterium]